MLNKFTEINDGDIFDTLEEALLTSCPLCGTPLDWGLSLVYDVEVEHNVIHAVSHSCGIDFFIKPMYNKDQPLPIGYCVEMVTTNKSWARHNGLTGLDPFMCDFTMLSFVIKVFDVFVYQLILGFTKTIVYKLMNWIFGDRRHKKNYDNQPPSPIIEYIYINSETGEVIA